MPLYDYECVECGGTFEAASSVSERLNAKCDKCGGPVKILIGQRSVQTFEPYFDIQLGMRVESRGMLKRVLKERGLMSVEDAPAEEVERVAARNREHYEEKERSNRWKKFERDWRDIRDRLDSPRG